MAISLKNLNASSYTKIEAEDCRSDIMDNLINSSQEAYESCVMNSDQSVEQSSTETPSLVCSLKFDSEETIASCKPSDAQPEAQLEDWEEGLIQDEEQELTPETAKIERTIQLFEELGLSEQLLNNIHSIYIEKPNSLQQTVLPLLINNPKKNIYLKARAHSGLKTSFLISSIHRIDPNLNKVQIIIVVPNIELIYYISESTKELSKDMNIKIHVSSRVDDLASEINDHLFVTTCGSFIKYSTKKVLNTADVKCIVFDELDLLLCNEKGINQFISILRHFRQCRMQFFSNAFNEESLNIIRRVVGTENLIVSNLLAKNFANNYLQFITHVENKQAKYRALYKILRNVVLKKIVIFFNYTPSKASFLYKYLKGKKFNVIQLLSKSNVHERLDAINCFNSSQEQTVLIVNYPLSTGIGLDDVSIIINFDLPYDNEYLITEYVHRLSKCITINTKPAFIVNFIEKRSVHQLKRLEKYFKCRMIRLNLRD